MEHVDILIFQAYTLSAERTSKYLGLTERGQIPEKELLHTTDDIQLIYLNTKYCFKTKRSGLNSYLVSLGTGPGIESEVRPLGDGGLLILLNGKSHVCYGNNTATGLRLILDGKTIFRGQN